MKSKGTLYLIPAPLTVSVSLEDIPSCVLEVIRKLSYFIVESKKSSAGYLKLAGARVPFELEELNEHTQKKDLPLLLTKLESGIDTGLLSDAGVPCIADPGSELVRLAHEKGIKVAPLPGPSSIILGLMASGLSGQNFRFHGYLPKGDLEREKSIKDLERTAIQSRESQIFIETPYRTQKLLSSIIRICSGETRICVAVDLREESELIVGGRVKDLPARAAKIGDRRAVIVIGK